MTEAAHTPQTIPTQKVAQTLFNLFVEHPREVFARLGEEAQQELGVRFSHAAPKQQHTVLEHLLGGIADPENMPPPEDFLEVISKLGQENNPTVNMMKDLADFQLNSNEMRSGSAKRWRERINMLVPPTAGLGSAVSGGREPFRHPNPVSVRPAPAATAAAE